MGTFPRKMFKEIWDKAASCSSVTYWMSDFLCVWGHLYCNFRNAVYRAIRRLAILGNYETKTIVNGVWAYKYETKRNITNFISQVEIMTDK